MKYAYAAILIFSAIIMTGCSDDDSSGTSLTVTIDTVDYTFECFRHNSASSNGYEYSIGCNQGQSKRLTLLRAFEMNGGEVKVVLTDVPDTTKFDSPYGINYECGDQNASLCPDAVPTFDAATTTISLAGVIVPMTNNRTGEFGDFVDGVSQHTITTSIDMGAVAYFQ